MGDNSERTRTRRLSSILKTVGANGDSPTLTFNRRSKRISFAHVNNVKEFVSDVDNQTIWGESYEKRESAASAASASSERCITNNITSCTSHQLNTITTVPTPNTIDLFADIEDDPNSDADMEMSSQQQRIPEPATIFCNQTMLIDDSTICGNAAASVTSRTMVDMSIASFTNKRRTNETHLTDEAIVEFPKSVKIRKLNQDAMELSVLPEQQRHHTILQQMDVDPSDNADDSFFKQIANLDVTRLGDIDLSVSDDSIDIQINSSSQSAPKLLEPDIPTSNYSDKTTVSPADMDRSMLSAISDTCKPNVNKTQYFGGNDLSGVVDQTLAVRNPRQENHLDGLRIVDDHDDSDEKSANLEDLDECENNIPVFQSEYGNTHHGICGDLSIPTVFKYKNETGCQSTLGNTDEHGIEDLTVSMDMNFRVEVSDDDMHNSRTKHPTSTLVSLSDSVEKESLLHEQPKKSLISDQVEPLTVFPDPKNNFHEYKENHSELVSQLSSLNQTHVSGHKSPNIKATEDMSLCSPMNETGTSAATSNKNKFAKTIFFGNSASEDHPFDPIADFTFGNLEPFSSTRVAPNNSQTLNFSDAKSNNNSTNVTFNFCPTPTTRQLRDLRSGMSSQNNTDELCNLEPDQLRKRGEMKKLFLDLSNSAPRDMLSETKLDLVGESTDEEFTNLQSGGLELAGNEKLPTKKHQTNLSIQEELVMNVSIDHSSGNSNAATIKTEIDNLRRCQRCSNCRRSLDSSKSALLKIEDLNELRLDFSGHIQFKGLASFKDVIAAAKQRKEARELEEQALVDQNVEAPDIGYLWENHFKTTLEPWPAFTPEPLTCLPMRMSIEYLMKNKIRTEYTKWKYFDNYFYIGAIALRHEKIPSIQIHIKFDGNEPKKAEELNMPLLFKRAFVEECPIYLNDISPRNYLKHKHGLATLPLNLSTIFSNSNNIYKGLDEIDDCFESVVANINEMELLTAEHEAFLKMEDRQCYIEKTVFDVKNYIMQAFTIKLDKIDQVGPRNVYFVPPCETTKEFKNLPIGLPFLRAFLSNPKSFLVPFLQK